MKYIFSLLALVSFSYASELSNQEILDQQTGLSKWRRIINDSSHINKEELIALLGEGVRKTSMPIIYSIEGTEQVHLDLKKKLISIPGHAEFYKIRSKVIREKLESYVISDSRNSKSCSTCPARKRLKY